ncbi:hypothetical protein BC936DRAFT_140183 [Jimgerdemannia flammicorona]|uniref:Uncharacterized protein n=1 Tax=Jimgerdemannia flammicorona TaxID=994334 RepID=A0A433DH79_9FUNG|nr:hypothetical protein BC936DRAFT_140183 [Jimgerdemannia flammicorona]
MSICSAPSVSGLKASWGHDEVEWLLDVISSLKDRVLLVQHYSVLKWPFAFNLNYLIRGLIRQRYHKRAIQAPLGQTQQMMRMKSLLSKHNRHACLDIHVPYRYHNQ